MSKHVATWLIIKHCEPLKQHWVNTGIQGYRIGPYLWNRVPKKRLENYILHFKFLIFPLAPNQSKSEAHPAFYPMSTGGPFPGSKARPGRDADHSLISTAEVKNK
jgi:hypothetical protein